MQRPEQALQRAVVGYLGWALAPPAVFTSFPAGGGGRVRGAVLKGTGLRAGMPDVLIFHGGRTFGIELKAGTGLSEAQKALHPLLRAAGVEIAVAKSLDDVRSVLWGWRLPIRETKESTRLIRAGFLAPLWR